MSAEALARGIDIHKLQDELWPNTADVKRIREAYRATRNADWVTVTELARETYKDENTIYRYIARQEFPTIKKSGRRLIDREQFYKWYAKQPFVHRIGEGR